MKAWDWTRGLCCLWCALLLASEARAADVIFYSVSKSLKYNQISAAPPTLGINGYRFSLDVAPTASNSVLSASVTAAKGAPVTLSLDPSSSWLTFEIKSSSQAGLDSFAPAGKYSFELNTAHDGQRTLSLTLTTPEYPIAPRVSDFTAAQTIDPGQPFTLTWDRWAAGTFQDIILFRLGDAAKNVLLLQSPQPFQPGALDGTAKSFVIPAGTLQPNTQYLVEVNFIKIQSVDQTTYPGAAGVVASSSFTDANIATAASSPHFNIAFRQFAQGGKFLGRTNATPSFPALLNGYRAVITVTNDVNFPPANQVLITGPAGSGLTNTAADTAASSITATAASYLSPRLTEPTTASGGTWLLNYKGADKTLTVADPQLSADLVVPVPRVTVAGDVVKSVSWSFFDENGAALPAAPSYLSGIHVQTVDATGAFNLDSGALPGSQQTYALTTALNWSAVATLRFMYNDNRGESYVITFPKVATNPFTLAAVPDANGGFSVRLSGDVGRGYLLQFSDDFVYWNDLVTTNLTAPTITVPDPSAKEAPVRFYRGQLAN